MSRAVWFTAPRKVELRDDFVREPRPGEVTVQAHYSLISPGSEMHVYRGDGGLPDALIPTMQGTFSFPVKFGYQTVGEIIAAGADVDLQVGERVFCTHPHQETFTLPARFVEPIAEGLDLKRAAFAGMIRVAVNCHLDAPVRVGEVVVVTGLGMIGTFCALLARQTAHKLILVDPSQARRQRADWIGADALVGPEEAADVIAELTDGVGADVWNETSGNGGALQLAIDHTAQEGVVAVPGWYGLKEVSLRLSPEFHLHRLRIVSSWVGAISSGMQPRWTRERLMRVANAYLAKTDIRRIITHELPLAEAPVAYQLIDQTPEDTLGVLLVHDAALT